MCLEVCLWRNNNNNYDVTQLEYVNEYVRTQIRSDTWKINSASQKNCILIKYFEFFLTFFSKGQK